MDIKEQKRVSRLIAHHILDELEENERKNSMKGLRYGENALQSPP